MTISTLQAGRKKKSNRWGGGGDGGVAVTIQPSGWAEGRKTTRALRPSDRVNKLIESASYAHKKQSDTFPQVYHATATDLEVTRVCVCVIWWKHSLVLKHSCASFHLSLHLAGRLPCVYMVCIIHCHTSFIQRYSQISCPCFLQSSVELLSRFALSTWSTFTSDPKVHFLELDCDTEQEMTAKYCRRRRHSQAERNEGTEVSHALQLKDSRDCY